MSDFKPLHNRVLVKPEAKKEVFTSTEFGFILPQKEEDIPTTGIVVVGNKEVKKGEKILFSKFGFDTVKIEDEPYFVVSDYNILGIFK